MSELIVITKDRDHGLAESVSTDCEGWSANLVSAAEMASDTDTDTPFTDCGTSGTDGGRKRPRQQESVTEMFRRAEGRKAKRRAQSRGSPSPGKPAVTSPGAGRAVGGAESAGGVELSAASLEAIQRLIEVSSAKVIKTFEAKCEQFEKRIFILESEVMDREQDMKQLNEQLQAERTINRDLQRQIEGIDVNRRLSSLILTCSDFEPRTPSEDIEERIVGVLNQRFQDLRLTTADIQAAHRLQKDSKVIVKFVRRRVRDEIYDRRFELARRDAGVAGGLRSGAGGRRPKPLYINESLSPTNRTIYTELLEARKSSNGSRVASVFSRRGIVYCRRERGGANVMVPDLPSLRKILEGGSGSPPRATRSTSRRPPPGDGAARLTVPAAGSSSVAGGSGGGL